MKSSFPFPLFLYPLLSLSFFQSFSHCLSHLLKNSARLFGAFHFPILDVLLFISTVFLSIKSPSFLQKRFLVDLQLPVCIPSICDPGSYGKMVELEPLKCNVLVDVLLDIESAPTEVALRALFSLWETLTGVSNTLCVVVHGLLQKL